MKEHPIAKLAREARTAADYYLDKPAHINVCTTVDLYRTIAMLAELVLAGRAPADASDAPGATAS